MAQITTGVRRILSKPLMYEFVQNIFGAKSFRERIAREAIKPFEGLRVLDIGCGPARILDHLPGVKYVGYDISAKYIDDAKRNFGNRGTFHSRVLDISEAKTLDEFDVILAFGILHHLNDGDAQQLITVASTLLGPGGRLITVDPTFTNDQSKISRFLVSKDRGQNVRSPEGYLDLDLTSSFVIEKSEVRHRKLPPYSNCEILWSRG